jgi:NTE family protein
MNAAQRAAKSHVARKAGQTWPPKKLSIGLQGGGSFGAFTWGVLDFLLEQERLSLDTLSGASAGAVNGVLLASGLLEGGKAEAKARLGRFWRRMSAEHAFYSSATLAMKPFATAMSRFSPHQLNPFNFNPLREALKAEVDFDALRAHPLVKLMISTTRVADGRQRIFREDEVSLDVVMASTCLPLLHHTVTIEGEDYWDGGYVSNPPLLPLALASKTTDILAVLVTPNSVERLPTNRDDIIKRIEQIQFNAPMNAEFEALRLGAILGMSAKFERLRLTRISASDEIDDLANRSGADLSAGFIETLHRRGYDAARCWLENGTGSNVQKNDGVSTALN